MASDTKLKNLARGLGKGARGLNERLKVILDSLQDELLVADRDCRILFTNRAALKRFNGKDSRDVVGRYCYSISHNLSSPGKSPESECPLHRVWETGKAILTTHRYADATGGKGDSRFLSILASPIRDDEGNVIAITELVRDVTEARKLEAETAEAHSTLAVLGSIASAVSQSLDLDTVLKSALDEVLKVMRADVGGILLFDHEKQMLCYRAHRGFSSGYVQKVCYYPNEDIDGQVLQTGKAILIDDVRSDPRARQSAIIAAEGLKTFVSVPLRAKSKTLGVINICSREPHRFSSEDVHLLNSITPQIAMAVENAELYREVQLKDQIRRELLKEIFSIQEDERQRISRELHDETSQSLASMAASLEAVMNLLPENAGKAKAEIKKVQALSLSILGEIHKLIYELRPSLLDDLGLVAATRWLASNLLVAAGISFDLKTAGRGKRLPAGAEVSLFRVIQEAISNIARHSHARKVSLRIGFGKDAVSVQMTDDGTGFDVEEAINSRERPRGLGLVGMKERVEFMGGKLNIESHPDGRGTRIDIEIPLVCSVPVNPKVPHG